MVEHPVLETIWTIMLETGLTIYLKLTPGQLKSRLSGTNGERPLIKDLGDEGLLSFIEEKLAFREKWYNRAELTFNGFDTDIRLIYSQGQVKTEHLIFTNTFQHIQADSLPSCLYCL